VVKTVEFEAKLDSGADLKVCAEFAAQVRTDQPLQVILTVPDCDDEAGWRWLSTDQFLRTYADGDSIYDSA